MTADLVATLLGQGGAVRTVPTWRVEELLESVSGEPIHVQLRTIQASLAPRWIVAGRLYREGRQHVAALEVIDGPTLASVAPFQVRANRLSDLSASAFRRVGEAVGAGTERSEAARYVPDSDRVLRLHAEAVRHVRRFELRDATEKLREVIRLAPEFLDARVLLATALRNAGFERDALTELDEAGRIARDRDLAEDSLERLSIRAVRGSILDPQDAQDALRRLVERFPDEPERHLAYAVALRERGENEDALRHVDRAIELDPENGRSHLVRAPLVAYFDDRLEQAAELYERAAQGFEDADLPARSASVRQYAGAAYFTLRRTDEAIAVYRRVAQRMEEAGQYRQATAADNTLGAILLRTGDPLEAERAFVRTLDRARTLANERLLLHPLLNLSLIRARTGRADRALEDAGEALEIARRLDLARSVCDARQLRAMARAEGSEPARGIDELREVADDEECGDRVRSEALEWAAWYLWTVERPWEAFELSRPPPDGTSSSSISDAAAVILGADLARVHASIGRVEDARRGLRAARELYARSGTSGRDVDHTLALARATVTRLGGEPHETVTIRLEQDPRYGPGAWVRLLRAEAALDLNEPDSALREADAVIADSWSTPAARVRALAVRAAALLALGRAVDARTAAESALDGSRRLGLVLSEARTCALLARDVAFDPDGSRATCARRALDRYLDTFPQAARAAAAGRLDVARLATAIQQFSDRPDAGDRVGTATRRGFTEREESP
jgi:tetratricopeptide (TPR) repeat protein